MPRDKRQFKNTSKAPTYYDRKVIHTKTTRMLSMGKIIPKDWQYVRIHLRYSDPMKRHLIIVKLMGAENYTQTKKYNTEYKPNTSKIRPTNRHKYTGS